MIINKILDPLLKTLIVNDDRINSVTNKMTLQMYANESIHCCT